MPKRPQEMSVEELKELSASLAYPSEELQKSLNLKPRKLEAPPLQLDEDEVKILQESKIFEETPPHEEKKPSDYDDHLKKMYEQDDYLKEMDFGGRSRTRKQRRSKARSQRRARGRSQRRRRGRSQRRGRGRSQRRAKM